MFLQNFWISFQNLRIFLKYFIVYLDISWNISIFLDVSLDISLALSLYLLECFLEFLSSPYCHHLKMSPGGKCRLGNAPVTARSMGNIDVPHHSSSPLVSVRRVAHYIMRHQPPGTNDPVPDLRVLHLPHPDGTPLPAVRRPRRQVHHVQTLLLQLPQAARAVVPRLVAPAVCAISPR